jgi:isopentenyl diphosphate isomerase/L-lactate dehydrogenase-like FMN-dependent dehydrogenase
MNPFVALLSRQLAGDVRSLPARTRARFSSQRVQRYGTIDELRAAARRGLPRVMFDFVDGAANDEVTAGRNRSDFAELSIRPRVLVDVSEVTLATTVLGTPVSVPVLGGPMGLNALVHHSGELGVARAVHGAGSIYVLGAMASYSIEEIARESPGPTWFQIYIWKDRGLVRELVERSRAAGHLALVVTVDVPVAAARDRDRRNGFGLPPRATLRSLAGGLVRPRWSSQFIRHPRLTFANLEGHGGRASDPVHMTEYIGRQFDPSATWEDLSWCRELWPGPLVVKGILRPEDAATAVSLGVDAIAVSNHGGRQLDHTPSSIRTLPAIVDAVAGQAEVYFDGGIRRGSDILKALALGARACLIGRPLVYGLGAGGEAGAVRTMEILTAELRTAMGLAGCPAVSSLDPSWVGQATASNPDALNGVR